MNRFVLMVIVLFSIKSSMAQFENTETGARATGLNGAFTSLSNNSLAVFYNPSGLGQLKFREISVYYSPSVFGINELSQAAFSYAEPLKFGTAGLGIKSFGFDLYKELNIFLSFGKVFQKKIFLGLNVNYFYLNIQNYNSASSIGIDFGTLAYVTDFLKWGFTAKNLTGSVIGDSKEKIPQIYRTGVTFQFIDDLILIAEFEKDVRYPLSIKSGFEFSATEQVDLRSGISTEPVSFTAGIGFAYGIFQLDYTVNSHQDLGISHQGSVTINFGGNAAKKYYQDQLKNAFKQ